jgi:alpha-galactosidase
MPENTLFAFRTFGIPEDVLCPHYTGWPRGETASITNLWNGEPADSVFGEFWNNSTHVVALWDESSLFFRFRCAFDELHVRPDWGEGGPIGGLWDADVAEVFLQPPGSEVYFEVEVSPLGQWIDVCVVKPRQIVDFDWRSEITARVQLVESERIWWATFRLPFSPMLEKSSTDSGPCLGDVWRVNLFRIAGKEPVRQCMSWQPTHTAQPDFHVPSAFGNLIFLEDE